MLTVYAFSTENWTRPQDEVSGLMRLLADSFIRYLDRLIEARRAHPAPGPGRPAAE